jgi:hypothetical protein
LLAGRDTIEAEMAAREFHTMMINVNALVDSKRNRK